MKQQLEAFPSSITPFQKTHQKQQITQQDVTEQQTTEHDIVKEEIQIVKVRTLLFQMMSSFIVRIERKNDESAMITDMSMVMDWFTYADLGNGNGI